MDLLPPAATVGCEVRQDADRAGNLGALNLEGEYYGWGNAMIVALFRYRSSLLMFPPTKLPTKDYQVRVVGSF